MIDKTFPQKIRAFGRNLTVVYQPELRDEEGNPLCGQWILDELTIEADPTQHSINLQDTLLHELVHAISDLADLELTERQVLVLSTSLLGILLDNPKFSKFILQKEKK